jgi:hypothetical protein
MDRVNATPSATRRDCRQVGMLAVISALTLAAIGFLDMFVPPSVAPRVNIRWADGVSESARVDVEHQLKLVAGEHIEATTWAYDLADPSREAIEAIVTHPSVADTHHIDRSRRTLSSDAPLGSTRIRGGLSRWRDAATVPWLTRFASSVLIVSGLWLATTGRPALGRGM